LTGARLWFVWPDWRKKNHNASLVLFRGPGQMWRWGGPAGLSLGTTAYSHVSGLKVFTAQNKWHSHTRSHGDHVFLLNFPTVGQIKEYHIISSFQFSFIVLALLCVCVCVGVCVCVCVCVCTWQQLFQGVVPGLCVFCRGVVEVHRLLLQPLAPPPAAEQGHAEHGSPRRPARRSPPLHLHGEHVTQRQNARLRHDARLRCRERGGVNAQHLNTTRKTRNYNEVKTCTEQLCFSLELCE